jgi:hypothetical protein
MIMIMVMMMTMMNMMLADNLPPNALVTAVQLDRDKQVRRGGKWN